MTATPGSAGAAGSSSILAAVAHLAAATNAANSLAAQLSANGEEQRRQMMMGAEAKRYEGALAEESGNAKRDAAYISGTANLFKGASSLFSTYGGGGPKGRASVEDRTFDSTSSIGVGGINWDLT